MVGKVADGDYVLGIGLATLGGCGDFGLRSGCGGHEAHQGNGDKDSTHKFTSLNFPWRPSGNGQNSRSGAQGCQAGDRIECRGGCRNQTVAFVWCVSRVLP